MISSENEKIELAENAFRKFIGKINALSQKQRFLFEKILKRIEERKITKLRKEIANKKNNLCQAK